MKASWHNILILVPAMEALKTNSWRKNNTQTLAPLVATFLSGYDLSGKTIVPFCTHGGGGLGRVERDIATLCPQSIVLSSFEIYGSGTGNAQVKVAAWLHKIGMVQ